MPTASRSGSLFRAFASAVTFLHSLYALAWLRQGILGWSSAQRRKGKHDKGLDGLRAALDKELSLFYEKTHVRWLFGRLDIEPRRSQHPASILAPCTRANWDGGRGVGYLFVPSVRETVKTV